MFYRQHRSLIALSWRLLMIAIMALAPLASRAADLAGVRQDGREVTSVDIPGWKLVYFGYTHCPDVCPISLQSMAQAIDALGPVGERITPIFVTVDPERDTPGILAEYVSNFHPRMIGIVPHPEQLPALAKAWRVKYARVDTKDANSYAVDHTAAIFLADPAGTVVGRYQHDLDGNGLADRIRASMLAR